LNFFDGELANCIISRLMRFLYYRILRRTAAKLKIPPFEKDILADIEQALAVATI
jgi:hypothetical protein